MLLGMRTLREILASRTGRLGSDAAAVIVAVVLAVTAFALTARSTAQVGPATLVLRAAPALHGGSVVELPPFGEVRAKTHSGPVRIVARVERIDIAKARALIETATPVTGLGDVGLDDVGMGASGTRGLPGALWRATLLGGLAAFGVAALVLLAARRSRVVVVGGLLAVLVIVGVPMGVATSTWGAAAFREPTLTGGLAYLPELADVFSYRVARIEKLRTQAAKVANSLAAYYADDRSLANGGTLPDTYRVVHVTDLHLDSVGAELAANIARSYEASLVIDTGDAPILGVEPETALLASLLATDVPRVYVPGNHDSPASIAALAKLPGVTVLTSGTVEIDGLRIRGVPDPVSRGFGVEPDAERMEMITTAALARLERDLASGETTPDILAIHNPAMERPFIGFARVILSGHTHSARMYVSGGTVRLNSGTTGGMPYAPESSGRRALPHGASVLYYTRELPRTLVAVDRIEIHADRTTTVSRKVFADEPVE